MDEAKIIEVIKNNPELIKSILYNTPVKTSNNKKLNKYLEDKIAAEFPNENAYYVNYLRTNITAIMRKALGVTASKEVPDEKYEKAKSFYDEAMELIIKYRE